MPLRTGPPAARPRIASPAATPPIAPLTVVGLDGPLRMHTDLGGLCGPVHDGRALARDVLADAAARAALVGRPGAVLCLAGAAWVHSGPGAGPVPPAAEHTPLPGTRDDRLPRALVLAEEDVQCVAGTWLTTPLRTGLDVARTLPRTEAVHWLLLLAEAGHPLDAWHRDPRLRRRGGSWPRANLAIGAAIRFRERVSPPGGAERR